MSDPSQFLCRYHVEFAAPRSCGSYGGLSMAEAVETAIAALAPFGYALLRRPSESLIGTELWTSDDGETAVALIDEIDSSRHGYLIVAGRDDHAVDRLTEILRKLLPLVELNGGRGHELGWELGQLARDTYEEAA